MNFTLLVVVLLTAIAFVGIVIALSNAIAPRSYNAQKMEPYECGIPTRGKSWMQFRVGYYLFAILFLMFEWKRYFCSLGQSSPANLAWQDFSVFYFS